MRGRKQPQRQFVAVVDVNMTLAAEEFIRRFLLQVLPTGFQGSKDDLGLDQYEGRFRRRVHHHLLLAAIAYLVILTIYPSLRKVLG